LHCYSESHSILNFTTEAQSSQSGPAATEEEGAMTMEARRARRIQRI